ncbi:MAG: hypothetical protein HY235_05045 [Acidobacteria bacterium]|nr:hypothetical protein [Acidobacteriota bacterium]
MTHPRILAVAALLLAVLTPALAADVTGKWTAQFETQIGQQNYTYEFKVDGNKLTGKAASGRGEVPIQEGALNGDDISFVEVRKFQDQEIRIEYKGKVSGDEMKLTRKVGDFATTEIVARRAK